ncbi:MAG: hypothetical protein GY792_14410 [Gammaproteobacteria bacterium]|nr:hypothetical protein [Gammaproteobacteria bacterium]
MDKVDDVKSHDSLVQRVINAARDYIENPQNVFSGIVNFYQGSSALVRYGMIATLCLCVLILGVVIWNTYLVTVHVNAQELTESLIDQYQGQLESNQLELKIKNDQTKALTDAIIALQSAPVSRRNINSALQGLEDGNPEKAKVIFIKVLAKIGKDSNANPEAAEAARHWGTFAVLTDSEEALTAYRRAVGLDGENSANWKLLGHVLYRAGESTEALAAYRRVAELEANNPGQRQAQPVLVGEEEPNDTYAQALEVPFGIINGELSENDNEDYYTFEVPNSHVLSLAFTPDEEAAKMNIQLFDPEREQIWVSRYVKPGVTKSVKKIMNTFSGGIYYLKVSDAKGKYTVDLASKSQNDADSGGDAADDIGAAFQIKTELVFSGALGGYDQEDWYAFEIPNQRVLSLAFTPDEKAAEMDIQLFDPEREQIWSSWNVNPEVTRTAKVIMNTLSGGMYYLKVSDAKGKYMIALALESQHDASSRADAGDKKNDALKINRGKAYTGGVGHYETGVHGVVAYDVEDWYEFTPAETQTITFMSDKEGDAEMDIEIFNFEEKQTSHHWNITPGVSKSFTIQEVTMPPYFVKVSGNGRYIIKIE